MHGASRIGSEQQWCLILILEQRGVETLQDQHGIHSPHLGPSSIVIRQPTIAARWRLSSQFVVDLCHHGNGDFSQTRVLYASHFKASSPRANQALLPR